MPETEARKAWTAEHTTRVTMKLNNHTDADILKKLSEVPSMSGYIKSAIRSAIARGE